MTQSPAIVDLRSDTVTLPSPEMRKAIAAAPVGDDQFGEDPSVNLLQERVAELLNKEAALWLPTGTMANQAALRALTQRGDDVIVSRGSHAVWHESGASAANSGVQFTELGNGGLFTAEDFRAAIKPRGHIIYPPTTLVEIENTHNRAGGVIFPQSDVEEICAIAQEQNIATYLDGARLWNTAVARKMSPAELAAPFDLVSVAFSKGLGAPGGSMLAGSEELIVTVNRCRRMLGGAMRQAGFFASAGLYALDHNYSRLADDHANAQVIAKRLALSAKVTIDPGKVQTNIIVFDIVGDATPAVAQAKERSVLVFAFGPHTIRAVTHLNLSTEQCERGAGILTEIIDEL
jgi:threonine aldolase